MAEICFECWKNKYDPNCSKRDFIISKTPELCEECGQIKPVIIRRREFGGYPIKQYA